MKRRSLVFALVLTILLLGFGGWLLAFFQTTLADKRLAAAPAPQERGAPQKAPVGPPFAPELGPLPGLALFNPPRPEDAPQDIRGEVMLGYLIMSQTKKYAGAYVGNDLSCSSCHFDAGRNINSISLVGVGAVYPQYRSRQDYTVDLAMRVQDCFARSMNGSAPPLDSQVMQSLLVYLQWISKDIPVYAKLPWALPADLGIDRKPDKQAGAKVYQDVCTPCHGGTGQGTPIAPPLWGERSYNAGAGMHRLGVFSVFAWRFMPKNAPSLSKEQALDVAAYVNDQPRPQLAAGHSDSIERLIPLPEGE